jgi:primosomal replication protein N
VVNHSLFAKKFHSVAQSKNENQRKSKFQIEIIVSGESSLAAGNSPYESLSNIRHVGIS